jgi:hypothetical protein|tara:strand:+ start:72 stop:398 length:327 start_codon:yes stop_codon:yes gene_type:complete
MIKNKLTIAIIIFFSILLYSCQVAKEAFGGKKRSEQGDEFLVEKKNPLAMPPDYEKLPVPSNDDIPSNTFSENEEVKDLLNLENVDGTDSINDGDTLDIESSIIKKIQ